VVCGCGLITFLFLSPFWFICAAPTLGHGPAREQCTTAKKTYNAAASNLSPRTSRDTEGFICNRDSSRSNGSHPKKSNLLPSLKSLIV
jgi:hypothetical protein